MNLELRFPESESHGRLFQFAYRRHWPREHCQDSEGRPKGYFPLHEHHKDARWCTNFRMEHPCLRSPFQLTGSNLLVEASAHPVVVEGFAIVETHPKLPLFFPEVFRRLRWDG